MIKVSGMYVEASEMISNILSLEIANIQKESAVSKNRWRLKKSLIRHRDLDVFWINVNANALSIQRIIFLSERRRPLPYSGFYSDLCSLAEGWC